MNYGTEVKQGSLSGCCSLVRTPIMSLNLSALGVPASVPFPELPATLDRTFSVSVVKETELDNKMDIHLLLRALVHKTLLVAGNLFRSQRSGETQRNNSNCFCQSCSGIFGLSIKTQTRGYKIANSLWSKANLVGDNGVLVRGYHAIYNKSSNGSSGFYQAKCSRDV